MLDHAWYTHPGGHRENQDALRLEVTDGRAQAVVCDGLGGMVEGATAAAICADAVVAALAAPSKLHDAAVQAASVSLADGTVGTQAGAGGPGHGIGHALLEGHWALLAAQEASPGLKQARSTAAAAVIADGALTWANVGDSRIYRFKGGRLAEVSPDDSAGYAAFRRGEVDHEGIRLYDGRSHLTAALGDERELEPHTGGAALEEGDAVLVCSDGFWSYVWDLEMEIDLAKSSGAADWLELMLLRLVQRSRLDGDNLTVAAFVVGRGA